jgi:CHAT domain-containing protein
MTNFHRSLRKGEHPADALAAAQRRFIEGEADYRHPFFWAGFLVYGNAE